MSKHVLVIDDVEEIRELFILTLEYIGYQVETVESGKKGIELVKGKKYDLIFLDLKMPGLNGIETLREIRKIDKNVPIYIITGFQDEFSDQLKLMEDEGIKYGFLNKPIKVSELIYVTKGIPDEALT